MKLRSRALIVLVAAAVVAPVGGAPASAADVAATVNGTDITVDDLDEQLEVAMGGGTVPGETARSVLTTMIANVVTHDALVDAGADPDAGAADGETADVTFSRYLALLDDAGLAASDRDEYEVGGQIGDTRCALVAFGTDRDAVEEAGAGLLGGSESATADSDVAESAPGESEEEDPGVTIGGLGGGPDNPCDAVSSFGEELGALVADALDDVSAGETSDVVEIDEDNYGVFAIPAWDDVEVMFVSGRVPAVIDLLADADVTVAPRYGRWDATVTSVVALDAAGTDATVDTTADVAS